MLCFMVGVVELWQMMPSYHPEGLYRDGKKVGKGESGIAQLWHKSGRCAHGTIPVRRTREEDLLRASSIQSFGKKKHKTIPTPPTYAKPQPDLINQNGHQVKGISSTFSNFQIGFLKRWDFGIKGESFYDCFTLCSLFQDF